MRTTVCISLRAPVSTPSLAAPTGWYEHLLTHSQVSSTHTGSPTQCRLRRRCSKVLTFPSRPRPNLLISSPMPACSRFSASNSSAPRESASSN